MSEDLISKDFNLRREWLKELSKLKQKAFTDLVSSISTIVQTLGIIAGFGFTAINDVETIIIFIVGEVLLFSSIFYGIYKVHRIYEKENYWIDKMINKIDEAGQKLKDISIPTEQRHDNFKEVILSDEKVESYKSPLLPLIFLGATGSVFLLLSFVNV